MNKWTIKQLNETDDLLFAISILNERKLKLNPFSPLAEKISRTVARLNKIRDLAQSDANSHREVINSYIKLLCNCTDLQQE